MKIPEDPFVQELLPEFIDTWINDLDEQFPSILESKNTDDLYRLGHTLKGSCFQFGLDEIAELGIKLMGTSKESDWEQAVALFEDIKKQFVVVKEFVQKNL